MDVYAMLNAQSETIKKLTAENKKTVQEALSLVARYQQGIRLADEAIKLLEAKVKKLECEALGRSWDATKDGAK